MTAQDIILQARERLGDIKEQRWSNDRLLAIVSQGQVDICLETGYLRKDIILPLVNGESIYNLPRDCYSIKRVEYDGKLLPLHSRSDKDIPRAVMTDYVAYKSNLDMNKLEIQPEIVGVTTIKVVQGSITTDDNFLVTPIYGVVASTDDESIIVDQPYGVVTGMEIDQTSNIPSLGYGEIFGSPLDRSIVYMANGAYGVTTNIEYSKDSEYGFISEVTGHTVSGLYGLIGNISYATDTFRVYYVAIPSKLRYVTSLLVMPELWEEILIRYTVGTALQDDNDANNIARGEAELQKYGIKLATIADLSSKDFSSNTSSKSTTDYRRV